MNIKISFLLNEKVTKTFKSPDGKVKTMKVELFTLGKLDYVAKVKTAFKIKYFFDILKSPHFISKMRAFSLNHYLTKKKV